MAEVKIIITDTEEDGGVNFRFEFDPPLRDDQDILTHAQAEAAFLLEVMNHRAEGLSLEEMVPLIDESEFGDVVEGTKTSETVFDGNEDPN